MDIEAFPDIQDFQHLPRRVIVKGGKTSYRPEEGARLTGIVINNLGQSVRSLKVNLVVFDHRKIPVYNTSVIPDPAYLTQGGIGSFAFQLKDFSGEIKDYHLYAQWSFDREHESAE